jgi:thioredoxin 1
MKMLYLTKDNFEKEVTKSKIPVVVDFFADWCMPCRMMAPVFEELSGEFGKKVKFAKVNTENEGELASKFNIMSIPTLLIFKNGKEAGKVTGFSPKNELKEKIESFL